MHDPASPQPGPPRSPRQAAARFAAHARDAGLDAPVPTCPGWAVLDLVAREALVHRWATAVVSGQDPRTVDEAALEAQGRDDPDPVAQLGGARPPWSRARDAPPTRTYDLPA